MEGQKQTTATAACCWQSKLETKNVFQNYFEKKAFCKLDII